MVFVNPAKPGKHEISSAYVRFNIRQCD